MPAVQQRMSWSDNVIEWGPEDHPSVMPNPGNYALMVDAIVAAPLYSCKFTRTLIDGGSAINILYRDTMVKLGISESELEPSSARPVMHSPWPYSAGGSVRVGGKFPPRADLVRGSRS